MAPEQVASETQLLDGRCDIHALGILSFELLAGKSPFPAKNSSELREQILFRPPLRLREADSSLPKELEDICFKAMAKHPGDRFSSAEVFAEELRAWLQRSQRRQWVAFAIIAIAIGLLGAVGIWIGSMSLGDTQSAKSKFVHFDGKTRIVTDVKRTLPVTLAAWIKLDEYENYNCQFVIGSDLPGKQGIEIGVCGSVLSAETMIGMVNSSSVVEPGKWTHIAGVFTESETRLYHDGKLVASDKGAPTTPDARFVVGCVGEKNAMDFFKGEIRSVRISSGETYSDEFEPKEYLGRDTFTLIDLDSKMLNIRLMKSSR